MTLLLSIFVLAGITYLMMFLLVSPIKSEIERLESNVSMQKKFIDVLKQNQTESDIPVVSSTEIQKKIPVIPLVEQLLLEIEQAENVSGSEITSMSFSESDFTLAPTNEPIETTEEEETEAAELPITIDPAAITEGLRQVTVTISVQSPGYDELERFLSQIEHQTRITKVDSLSFTGKQEAVSINQEDLDAPLDYTVTVSTFYMPVYPELAEDAPKVNFPTPSEKKNPLFMNTSEQDDE